MIGFDDQTHLFSQINRLREPATIHGLLCMSVYESLYSSRLAPGPTVTRSGQIPHPSAPALRPVTANFDRQLLKVKRYAFYSLQLLQQIGGRILVRICGYRDVSLANPGVHSKKWKAAAGHGCLHCKDLVEIQSWWYNLLHCPYWYICTSPCGFVSLCLIQSLVHPWPHVSFCDNLVSSTGQQTELTWRLNVCD